LSLTTNQIAQICHEANRVVCQANGDDSQSHWEDAPQWQQESSIQGVLFAQGNPDLTPEDQHNAWSLAKTDAGWVRGDVKDIEAKTHPCIVPYGELPEFQRLKDVLFRAIVLASSH
jgi:hypothetical protein